MQELQNPQFADLHLHSKYSRATSKNSNIEELARNAKIKGLTVLGTGDFTHPLWLKEIREKLSDENGIYDYDGIKFIPSGEISLMYSQGGKGRRIHHVLLAPNFEVVDQINEWLLKKGRLNYDGRPIFGFSSIELVENMMNISKDIMIIPAHCWTPWFSIFGSMSGFDSVEECFQDKAKHIYALETGLSSNPAMNWRMSNLDRYSLVSFSDSHSPFPNRIGRECCVFDIKDIAYNKLIDAIKTRRNFSMTIEFFPEEGKYHFDGHRACNISMHPSESNSINKICPVCNKGMVIGVLNRVEELADRPENYVPKDRIPFKSFIPLIESIAFVQGSTTTSKKVTDLYNQLIASFGNELNILLNVPSYELKKCLKDKIANFIIKMREGKIKFDAGYDGVYGRPIIENDEMMQKGLGRFV